MRHAITRALAREYMLSLPPYKALTPVGFRQFLTSYPQDDKFSFIANVMVLREMAALYLFRAGLRQGIAVAVSAARKMMLPVMFARNSIKYAPAVLMEIIVVQWSMLDIVRRHVEIFTSFKGQGWVGCLHAWFPFRPFLSRFFLVPSVCRPIDCHVGFYSCSVRLTPRRLLM